MIQRIQSFYLLVIVVLFGVLLFTPLIDFSQEGRVFILNYQGIVAAEDPSQVILNTILLTALEGVVMLLAFISIFLFKNRLLQIRLTIANIVLMIGFYAMLFVYVYVAKTSVGLDFHLRMPVVFPLVGIILSWLAVRAIGKDERLVRSLNRIR